MRRHSIPPTLVALALLCAPGCAADAARRPWLSPAARDAWANADVADRKLDAPIEWTARRESLAQMFDRFTAATGVPVDTRGLADRGWDMNAPQTSPPPHATTGRQVIDALWDEFDEMLVASPRCSTYGGVLTIGPPIPWDAKPRDLDDAYRTLRESRRFMGAAVGYAGAKPPEYAAYERVLASHHAADIFADLAERSSPAARLYAYHGLAHLADPRREPLRTRLLADTASLRCQFACIVSSTTVAELIAEGRPK